MAELSADDIRKLERSVIATRGDLLFARAIVLFEGETEEQAFPLWAQVHWGASPHELGFNFIGVGGTDYFPYMWLAEKFGIAWFVFSDGEDKPVATLAKDAKRAGVTDIGTAPNIVVLPHKDDLEAHLLREGYMDAFEQAIATYASPVALDEYIQTLHGTNGKKVNGIQQIRNYVGLGGRERAALDMVSDKKTRYATPITNAILNLTDPTRRIPAQVRILLDKVGQRFNIPVAPMSDAGLSKD